MSLRDGLLLTSSRGRDRPVLHLRRPSLTRTTKVEFSEQVRFQQIFAYLTSLSLVLQNRSVARWSCNIWCGPRSVLQVRPPAKYFQRNQPRGGFPAGSGLPV